MIPLSLHQIAAATSGSLVGVRDPERKVFDNFAFHSEGASFGSLFAYMPGTGADQGFVNEAIRNGAPAVLSATPVNAPTLVVEDVTRALGDIARAVALRHTGTTIAITGSTGKTCTEYLLQQLLHHHGRTVYGGIYPSEDVDFASTVTRVEKDTDFLILEMGARAPGHIDHLTGIARPDVCAVLNIGLAHLGRFGSMDATAKAHAEILRALPAQSGIAVLNGDDPLVRAMAEQTSASVRWFGTGEHNDVRATDIRLNQHGRLHLTLHADGQSAAVIPALYGRHHVTDILAAAALALAVGCPFATVAHQLDHASIAAGSRMDVSARPGFTVIDDTASASPESVHGALATVAHIAAWGNRHRPALAVLGDVADLGPAAATVHREIGERVVQLGIDRLVTVGGPDAELISETAHRGGARDVTHLPDREHLFALLRESMPVGCIALFTGRRDLGLGDVARALRAVV